jgi:uncharacterized protein (DUF2141 family)
MFIGARSMKILLTYIIIACTSPMVFAQHSLEITISNIKDAKGSVRIGLFSSENDFLKKAIDGKIVKATPTELTVVFHLKPGEYALSAIHDKNENDELDTNLIGIPTEPYGFSNNAVGIFGPPSFDKAKLIVQGDMTSVIRLK